jgi:hypothetical protein
LSTDTCQPCPTGSYSTLRDPQCFPCEPGYLCYNRTNRANPTNTTLHGGEACPKGYYCEGGTANIAVPCPKGTFND